MKRLFTTIYLPQPQTTQWGVATNNEYVVPQPYDSFPWDEPQSIRGQLAPCGSAKADDNNEGGFHTTRTLRSFRGSCHSNSCSVLLAHVRGLWLVQGHFHKSLKQKSIKNYDCSCFGGSPIGSGRLRSPYPLPKREPRTHNRHYRSSRI